VNLCIDICKRCMYVYVNVDIGKRPYIE